MSDNQQKNQITLFGEKIPEEYLSVKARALIGSMLAVEQKENQHRLSAEAYGMAKEKYVADLKKEINIRRQENEQSQEGNS